jgi:hypothetical protein
MKRMATIDFSKGRGFGPIAPGLPVDFLKSEDKTTVLTTIAMLFTNSDPMRTNTFGQAVALLALYAAGARVALDDAQYDQLVDKAAEYESIQRAPIHGHEQNAEFALYVLRAAAERARIDGLVA